MKREEGRVQIFPQIGAPAFALADPERVAHTHVIREAIESFTLIDRAINEQGPAELREILPEQWGAEAGNDMGASFRLDETSTTNVPGSPASYESPWASVSSAKAHLDRGRQIESG